MAPTEVSDSVRLSPDFIRRFTPPRTYHSSFVGRENDISEIKQLLRTSRFVTITGSGGCGKTRLAAEVAANSSEDFADGIAYTELATVTDPDHV